MTERKIIQIHQFSTGIKLIRQNGEWVSGGYDKIINSTLNQLPTAVNNSIINSEFKLGEATVTDKPSIIGREVIDNNEIWSVMAVVTKGKDNKGGRSPQLFRFFLAEGKGNLSYISRWWKDQGSPTYDSDQKKKIGEGKFDEYEITDEIEKREKDLQETILEYKSKYDYDDEDIPMILKYVETGPSIYILNAIAHKKLEELGRSDEPIAWAYNVTALVKTGLFQVVYPSSPEAEETLKQEKASLKDHEKRQRLSGEAEIEKTITKKIKGKGTVEEKEINDILNAISNPSMNADFWRQKFSEELKINDTMERATFSDDEVRLVWISSLFIPETLPDCVKWLMQRKFNSEPYEVVKTLNQAVTNALSSSSDLEQSKVKNLEDNVQQGIHVLVTALSKEERPNILARVRLIRPKRSRQPTFLEMILWLLQNHHNIWGEVFKNNGYLEHLDDDIQKILEEKGKRIKETQDKYFKLYGSQLPANSQQMTKELTNQLSSPIEGRIILSEPYWREVEQVIRRRIWLNPTSEDINSNFEFLAEFFKEISKINNSTKGSNVAALFYHLSRGKVPTSLWERCDFTSDSNTLQLPPSSEGEPPKEPSLWSIPVGLFIKYDFVIGFRPHPVKRYNNYLDEAVLYGIKITREIAISERAGRALIVTFRFISRRLNQKIPAFIVLLLILLSGYFASQWTSWKISHKDIDIPSALRAEISSRISKIKSSLSTINVPSLPSTESPSKTDPKSEKDIFLENTIPALEVIHQDFHEYLIDKDGNHPTPEMIINHITNQLDYGGKRELDFYKKTEDSEIEKWVEAIKSYQKGSTQKTIEPTGSFKKGDPTDIYLRCKLRKVMFIQSKEDAIKQCSDYGIALSKDGQEVPDHSGTQGKTSTSENNSTKPAENDWKITVESIDALRDEFVNMGQSKQTVEEAITKNVYATAAYQYIESNQLTWIPKIKVFQKDNNISETGKITENDETYNKLKCKVAETLKVTESFVECITQSEK